MKFLPLTIGIFFLPFLVHAEGMSVEENPNPISVEEFSASVLVKEPEHVSVPQTYTMALWAFFIVVLVMVLSSARRRSSGNAGGNSLNRPIKNTSITKEYEGDIGA